MATRETLNNSYNMNKNGSAADVLWEYNVGNEQTDSFNGTVYGILDMNITTAAPDEHHSDVLTFINLLIPPILVVFGVTFNCFTILTMRTRFFRKVSTSVYLKVGAINDATALMVSLVAHWLYVNFPSVYVRTDFSHLMCKFFNFYGSSNNDFGIIVTVSMTAERALVIASPFRATKYCSVARAWKVVLIMFMLIVLKNCHYLVASDIVPVGRTDRLCDVFVDDFGTSYKNFYEDFWPWFHLFYVVSCGIVIIISNSIILHNVRKSFAVNYTGKHHAWRHFGPMLLGESLLLVIFTFPFTIHLALLSIRLKYDPDLYMDTETAEMENLVFSITFYMLYSNKCVNFFMYCITGKQFRDGLVLVLLKCACREDKNRFRDRASTFRSTSSSLASTKTRTSTMKSNSSILKRSDTVAFKQRAKVVRKSTTSVYKRNRNIVSRIQSKRSCTSATILSKTRDISCQVLPVTLSKGTQTLDHHTDKFGQQSSPTSLTQLLYVPVQHLPMSMDIPDQPSAYGRWLIENDQRHTSNNSNFITNHVCQVCSVVSTVQVIGATQSNTRTSIPFRHCTNRDDSFHPDSRTNGSDSNTINGTIRNNTSRHAKKADAFVYTYVERYVTNFDLDIIETTHENFSMYL